MMASLPGGAWSGLIVGHQWPSDQAMAQIEYWKASRAYVSIGHEYVANSLELAKAGPLSMQSGRAAESISDLFDEGERLARGIAIKNQGKACDYSAVVTALGALREDLSDIASRGSAEIEQIQKSKKSTAEKAVDILVIVRAKQQEANVAAAKCAAEIGDAGQRMLDREGGGQSFRHLVKDHGIDMGQLFRSRDPQNAEALIARVLDPAVGTDSSAAQLDPGREIPANSRGVVVQAGQGTATGVGLPAMTSLGLNPPPVGVAQAPAVAGGKPQLASASFGLPGLKAPAAPSPVAPSSPGPTVPGAPVGSPPISVVHEVGNNPSQLAEVPSSPMGAAPSNHEVGTNPLHGPVTSSPSPISNTAAPPAPSAPPSPPVVQATATPAFTPAGWSQNTGLGAAPTLPAVSSGFDATTLSHPPAPAPAQFSGSQTFPSAGTGDWHDHLAPAPAPTAPAPALPPPAPEVLPAAPPSAPTPPPVSAPAGPLPAYGADLRPVAPTTPITAPAPPAVAASTAPSAGPAAVTHTAAPVRPVPPVPPAVPNFAGPATAFSAGAAAGAVSAAATATARLQRIVDAVARQQPRLAWAAGERADRTTVLATDLAGGWIPPGIDLPSVVTVLDPQPRHGDPQSLLGEVNGVATYRPGRYLPDDDEPLATSPRPRRAPAVEELNFELSRATRWRDGLPRLAHTLARAATAGTGVLDSEAALLRVELDRVRDDVLASYPEHVVPTTVGNWQLLAAIAALVAGDRTAANYHLAWFQAGG